MKKIVALLFNLTIGVMRAVATVAAVWPRWVLAQAFRS